VTFLLFCFACIAAHVNFIGR